MSDKTTTWASYAGALSSVIASLTLTDVGIMIGIVTAILTWFGNRQYKRHLIRLDLAHAAREQELHEAQLQALRGDRRQVDVPISFADRRAARE